MTRYRVNHENGIARAEEDDLEEGDVWDDPPEQVLDAFGDRLDRVHPEDDDSEESEDEEEEEEESVPPSPTEAELEELDRNELRSEYAGDIEEVDGNASAEDIREQILDYYAED
jgi:hypothetical protein